jgi:glycerate kinase
MRPERMRVVVAPNAFRGGPSATWLADIFARGLQGMVAEVVRVPLTDGGDGALEVAQRIMGGRTVSVSALDPLRSSVRGSYLITPDRTAFIESAQVSGLHLVDHRPRRPLEATTYGTGQLIAHALGQGVRQLIVSAGGMASLDLGAGALAALGARYLAADGSQLPPLPHELARVHSVDLGGLSPQLTHMPILALSDVTTNLDMSIRNYGSQKGITRDDEVIFTRFLHALPRAFGHPGTALIRTRLLGAGGGLSAGLFMALKASVRSGSDYFIEAAGLANEIRRSDLIITAEGRFDEGSLDGKLPYAVGTLAGRLGKPAVVITGDVRLRYEVPGIRFIELGMPPPKAGETMSTDRQRAFILAAQRAVQATAEL